MIDSNILSKNLNDQVSYTEYCRAFGINENDPLYLRRFKDKNKGDDKGHNMQMTPASLDKNKASIEALNRDDFGIFYVVNGDGQEDKQIKHARAQFMEIDPDDEDLERVRNGELTIDQLLERQIEKIAEFPLEPSIMVRTWKSIYAFWLQINGDIKRFRGIQKQLIQYFGSDPSIVNESRVMRLYGFEHRKGDPVMVRLLKFDPDLRYTQDQLSSILPEVKRTSKAATTSARDPCEKIKVGEGHDWCISKIGQLVSKFRTSLSDEAILAALETEFRSLYEDTNRINWDEFRASFLKRIKDVRAKQEDENNDPEFWSYAMRAWNDEHPDTTFEASGATWEDVRAAGEKAKEREKRFNEGLAKRQAARKQNAEEPADSSSGIDLLSVESTSETAVDWLIDQYIPRNNITILCGDGGCGKTTIWCELAAAISNGELPKFMKPFINMQNPFDDRRTVIYFSAEDDTGTVLRARLRKAGANLQNILYLGAESPDFQKIKFVSEELIALVEKYKPVLCVFDPLQSFLDDGVRMGERNAMRSRLDPLAGLATRANTTILILMHTNKREGAYGRNRMADSSDIWDRARSVLIAGKTGQDGVYYLSHEKCNYGRLGDTILYKITDEGIEYAGTSSKKDADYVREASYVKKDAPKRDDVKQMILDELSSGEQLVSELDDFIVNVMNVSRETLKRAKRELKDEGKIKLWKTGNQKTKRQEWRISLRGMENVT